MPAYIACHAEPLAGRSADNGVDVPVADNVMQSLVRQIPYIYLKQIVCREVVTIGPTDNRVIFNR